MVSSDHMHLIPRSNPSFPLPVTTAANGSTEEQSPLEINSLGYAGMLLVKSAAELEALENMTPSDGTNGDGEAGHSTGIMHVLEYCGVPRHWGDKPDEHQGGTEELMSALKGGQ
jgi:ATP adenylyltransferase